MTNHSTPILPPRTPPRSKSAAWKRLVKNLITSKMHAFSQPHLRWRLVYLLKKDQQTLSLQAFRARVKKDGTIWEMLPFKQNDSDDPAHIDHQDRMTLFRITSAVNFTLWRNGYGDHQKNSSSEWNPSELAFSDIFHLLAGKEVYLQEGEQAAPHAITIVSDPVELIFSYQEGKKEDTLLAHYSKNGTVDLLEPRAEILTGNPLWILNNNQLLHVRNQNGTLLKELQDMEWRLHIPATSRATMKASYLPQLMEQYGVVGNTIHVEEINIEPQRQLFLEEHNSELRVHLKFRYGNYPAPSEAGQERFVVLNDTTSTYLSIHRNKEFETQAHTLVVESGLEPKQAMMFTAVNDPLRWIADQLPLFAQSGFEIFGEESLRAFKVHKQPVMNIRIGSETDWFDFNLVLHYNGAEVSYSDFYSTINAGERFVRLSDGTSGMIPEEWIKLFKRAFSLTPAGATEWKFSRMHALLLDQLPSNITLDDPRGTFTSLREKIKSFECITEHPVPLNFKTTLRPYQKAGYDWLHFLKEFKFAGCLADDMGLGKTIQTLALLNHEYNNGAPHPTLVVVPTSLMFNWMNEARRFAPDLRVLSYSGTQRRHAMQSFPQFDLILTTYGTIRRDIDVLKELQFHYIILDESQNIKNYHSQTAKAVRQLQGSNRLVLTGTPVENNLTELWSQMTFLNPGLLGSEQTFREQFALPIEKQQDEETAVALRKIIYPFILRRTKDVVAKELPPKVEYVTYCDMDSAQKAVYNETRNRYRASILNAIDKFGLNKSRIKVLEGLMKLREICCHPVLIDTQYSGTSGKYEVWKTMLEEVLAEGHKVLVFSQYVKMLRVLSSHCDELGIDYEYLDGQTRDRQERVEHFQNDERVKTFLISLKAGGTGLNLTSADYVIHYDPWWNPAVEEQATDRTHRIGQNKNVFSYKLITRDSVEEKILALQEKKRLLVKSVITTEAGFLKSLTKKDIDGLFS